MNEPVCCDTSFLFSLYGNDTHTARAFDLVRKLARPVALTLLNDFEFTNATQFALFRRLLDRPAAAAMLAAYQADLDAGCLVIAPLILADALAEAKRLSLTHTAANGHRTLDVLHVAAASVLGAALFLTFDANQARLAQSARLAVL